MSSKTNTSATAVAASAPGVPVQLGQPQFPVKYGTVLYQLLESSSKESNRCSSHINVNNSSKPPLPKTPERRMRRSNIPIPIGRDPGPPNYRRFSRNPNVESQEESTSLLYVCKPVESRRFEESLRKYDNTPSSSNTKLTTTTTANLHKDLNRPTSRSAPTSRLPSPAGRHVRPATTITSEARRALSRAKVSSFRDSSAERRHYEGYYKESDKFRASQQYQNNKPPASPSTIRSATNSSSRPHVLVTRHADTQTISEPVKIKIHSTIDTQTDQMHQDDFNEDKLVATIETQTEDNANYNTDKILLELEAYENEFNGNDDLKITPVLIDGHSQTDEIHDHDTLAERREFISLLQEKDTFCAEVADQIRDKIAECMKLQEEVDALKSELEAIMKVNMGLQNKVLSLSKINEEDEQERESLSVFVQTEKEVLNLCANKSTSTTSTSTAVQAVPSHSKPIKDIQDGKCKETHYDEPDNNANLEETRIPNEEEQSAEEVSKVGSKSSLTAAKEWIDSSEGPPFDFSSLKTFSAEKFMKSPSCQDILTSKLFPAKQQNVSKDSMLLPPKPILPDPEPHPQMVELDRQASEKKYLQVLKAAIEQSEEIGSPSKSNVHTTKFIRRLQKKRDKQSRAEDNKSFKMSEMSLNPGEQQYVSPGRTSKERKIVSFDEEISESKDDLNDNKAPYRDTRLRKNQREKSRCEIHKEEPSRHHHRRRRSSSSKLSIKNCHQSKTKDDDHEEIDFDFDTKCNMKGWTPEEAESKRKIINKVFTALKISPKAKINEVCELVAAELIDAGSDFICEKQLIVADNAANVAPPIAAAETKEIIAEIPQVNYSERPFPRVVTKRRDLQRTTPALCLLDKM